MTDTDTQLTPTPTPTPSGAPLRQGFRLVARGPGGDWSMMLTGRSYTVGRSEDCDIRLADPAVSRSHLLLETRRDGVAFRDLGGVNGTLFDGAPIREGVLRPGDELLVGETHLSLQIAARQSDVRVLSSQHTTAVLSLSDTGDTLTDADSDGASRFDLARRLDPIDNPDPSERIVQTLDVLSWPWHPAQDTESTADRLLRAALQLTGRTRGMIGRYQLSGPLQVLATAQPAEHQPLEVSHEVLDRARHQRLPMLVRLEHDEDPSSHPIEQIVAPFGVRPDGVIVLQGPLPVACSGRAALRIASSFGHLVSRELLGLHMELVLRDEVRQLRFTQTAGYQSLVAAPRLSTVRRHLTEAARSCLPVRLVSEEGVEREELARLYHARSERSSGPFVCYYCGLVASPLAAKRLLGEPGDVVGPDELSLVDRAAGGTLFLDSPEHLDAEVQRRLAAILQLPSPSSGTQLRRVALVVAETEPGKLEPELAALFHGPTIAVPPLRRHADDISAVVEATLLELGRVGDQPRTVTEAALRALRRYDWPGNVRQLQRVVLAAAAHTDGSQIDLAHLPAEIRDAASIAQPLPSLQEMERRHIADALTYTSGNRTQAAQVLGIALSTLYQKIQKYGLAD